MLSEPEKRNIKSVWAQKVSLTSKKISGIPLKIGFLTPSEIVQKFLIKIFLLLPEPENPTLKSVFAPENFLTSHKILINFKDSHPKCSKNGKKNFSQKVSKCFNSCKYDVFKKLVCEVNCGRFASLSIFFTSRMGFELRSLPSMPLSSSTTLQSLMTIVCFTYYVLLFFSLLTCGF